MSDRSAEPAVAVAYSHLFAGLELDLPEDTFDVTFSDGAETDASQVTDPAGNLGLDVNAYRTRAGTEIPATVWPLTVLRRSKGTTRVKLGTPVRTDQQN